MQKRWKTMELARIRICGAIAVAALAAGLLAGCGEENTIDYSIEGMEQEQQQAGGSSRLEQFADAGVWKEAWNFKFMNLDGQMEEAGLQIQVNAPVTVPKTAQMSVVEVEEPEFDAAYKEEIAGRLFETGEIYYADYSRLPKKDLEDVLAGNVPWNTIINSPLSVEQMIEESRELQAALDNIENAGDSYIPVEDYSGNIYIGLCEGQMYTLSFGQSESFNDFCRTKQITWTVRNLREVCPEKMKEMEQLTVSPWTRGNWVENQCQISEEEALKEAQRFVDRLGMDYSVYSHAVPLLWGEKPNLSEVTGSAQSNDWYVDGYVFIFEPGVDDISFVGCGVGEDYEDFALYKRYTTDEKQYSMDAHLQVYVTEQGVIKMEADNPLEITSVKESVGLLSLDVIQGIIREKTTEQYDNFNFNSQELNFNEMELIYFRVRDRENHGRYSYVPTWRLAVVTRDEALNQISIRNHVLVNAIDGTLIDFLDET